MASGQATHQVPYGTLEVDMLKYIPAQYVPDEFSLLDPHNLKKRDIQCFLEHVKNRQDLHAQKMHSNSVITLSIIC